MRRPGTPRGARTCWLSRKCGVYNAAIFLAVFCPHAWGLGRKGLKGDGRSSDLQEMGYMSDEIDQSRRHFLTVATVVVGAVGAVMAAVPFVSSMEPSARAKALGGPVDIDISKIEPGGQIKTKWRGQPTWVVQRGQDAVANLKNVDGRLRDPESKEDQQPKY